MGDQRQKRTIQFFHNPEDADEQERERLRGLSPQERLDEMLDLVKRWRRPDERRLERVLAIIEL